MLQLAKSCSLLEGIEAERRRSERVAEAEAEADDGKAKKTTPINLTSGGGAAAEANFSPFCGFWYSSQLAARGDYSHCSLT